MLCVDESQIQALDRSQLVLTMMLGMPERRTPDYYRLGITSLFAAFDIAEIKTWLGKHPRFLVHFTPDRLLLDESSRAVAHGPSPGPRPPTRSSTPSPTTSPRSEPAAKNRAEPTPRG